MATAASSEPETISLYHYTNYQGYKGIANDRKIYDCKTLQCREKETVRKAGVKYPPLKRKRSSTGSVYGAGVYLTDKCPIQNTSREIAKNIWFGGVTEELLRKGRVNYVFAIEIKRDKVEKPDDSHENIWIYRKEALNLNDKDVVKSWRVYEVKEDHIKAFETAVDETIARLQEDRSPTKRTRSRSLKKAKR